MVEVELVESKMIGGSGRIMSPEQPQPVPARYLAAPHSPKPASPAYEGWNWDRVIIVSGTAAIVLLIVLEAIFLANFN